jgi:HNH endonuclease
MSLTLIRHVLGHSSARYSARLVLVAIAARIPEGGDTAQLSDAEMAHLSGLTRRAVISAVRRLELLGELSVEPGAGPGPGGYNRQTIILTRPLDRLSGDEAEDVVQLRRRALRSRSRQIWDRDGWECQARLPGCTGHKYLTIGHKIPIADGGSDADENVHTECQHCNGAKGAR